MIIELFIGIFLVLFMVLLLFMLFYFEYIKCRHIWKEQNRSNWNRISIFSNESLGEYIKVELRCNKCGDMKIVEI